MDYCGGLFRQRQFGLASPLKNPCCKVEQVDKILVGSILDGPPRVVFFLLSKLCSLDIGNIPHLTNDLEELGSVSEF